MYKIAICEDDASYIEFLKKVILATEGVDENTVLFFEFISGEQFLFYPEWDFDLVIMDMQIGEMDGYETARRLREIDKNLLLVFCSGVVKPTSESFKVTPFRYLLKSYTDDKMLNEMREIIDEMKSRKNYPYLMCKYSACKEQIRVYLDSILYIAIRHKGCEVVVCGKIKELYPNEVLRINRSLEDVCEIVNERYGFVRAHNSYIVNMAYIIETTPKSIKLVDGTELTVSRIRSKEFQRIFAEFVAAKYKG